MKPSDWIYVEYNPNKAPTILKDYDPYDKKCSAYRFNLENRAAQPEEPDTLRSALGKLTRRSEFDKIGADEGFQILNHLKDDPASQYYNPYNKPTNKAVSNLAALGVDTSNINDDWFKKNSYLTQYLTYDGTTNTPSKPGKKATAEQQAAYEYYQIWKSEDQTKKVENQWQALQQELAYWARRTDRNLSDDDIINKIDWSKYGELVNMDKNKDFQPTELNRAVDYSRDAMYGVLWAARNPEYQGDLNGAMANSYLERGNVWKNNPDITAKEDAGKDTFSPFELGSTMDEECAYFGVSGFNDDIINELKQKIDWNNPTDVKYYNNAVNALEYTKGLDASLAELQEDIQYLVAHDYNADEIIQIVKEDTGRYGNLFALDESMNKGWQGLKQTAYAVPYKWSNIEKQIRHDCEVAQKDNSQIDFTDETVNGLYADTGITSSASPFEGKTPSVNGVGQATQSKDYYGKPNTPAFSATDPWQATGVTTYDATKAGVNNSSEVGVKKFTIPAGGTRGVETSTDTYMPSPTAAPGTNTAPVTNKAGETNKGFNIPSAGTSAVNTSPNTSMPSPTSEQGTNTVVATDKAGKVIGEVNIPAVGINAVDIPTGESSPQEPTVLPVMDKAGKVIGEIEIPAAGTNPVDIETGEYTPQAPTVLPVMDKAGKVIGQVEIPSSGTTPMDMGVENSMPSPTMAPGTNTAPVTNKAGATENTPNVPNGGLNPVAMPTQAPVTTPGPAEAQGGAVTPAGVSEPEIAIPGVTPSAVNTTPSGAVNTPNADGIMNPAGRTQTTPKISAGDPLTKNTMPPKTTDHALEEANRKDLNTVTPAVVDNGTDEEKLVFKAAKSSMFDTLSAKLASAIADVKTCVNTTITDITQRTSASYMDTVRTIGGYEQEKAQMEKEQRDLARVSDRLKSLEIRYDMTGDTNAFDAELINDMIQDPGWEKAKEQLQSDDPWQQTLGYSFVHNYVSEDGTRSFFGGEQFDPYAEPSDDLKKIAELALNGGVQNDSGLNPLTVTEEEQMWAYMDEVEALEKSIKEHQVSLTERQEDYDNALTEQKKLSTVYSNTGIVAKAVGMQFDESLMNKIEVLYAAGQSWTAQKYTPNSVWDMAEAEGMKRNDIAPQAKNCVLESRKAIDQLQKGLEQAYALGINLSPEEERNIKQKISVMQEEAKDAGYYLLDDNPDFDQVATAAMAAGINQNMSPITKANVKALKGGTMNPYVDGYGFFSQLGLNMGNKVDAGFGQALANQMMETVTDAEKKRYFYLLATDGEDAANEYFLHLANPENGDLHMRISEALGEESREAAGKGGALAAASYLTSFMFNQVGNLQSGVHYIAGKITGEQDNPYDVAYLGNQLASSMREGVKDRLKADFNGNIDDVIDFVMDGISSAGDSALNSLITSGALDLAGEVVPVIGKLIGIVEKASEAGGLAGFGASFTQDFVHALPMGIGAAAQAAREAMISGADPDQIQAMFLSTMFAESISEALTYGNIKGAFVAGDAGTVKGMFTTLLGDKLEEFVGEGFNQWWEGNADRMIMGELSRYNQVYSYYHDQLGLPSSVAENMVAQEMTGDILQAAFSGFFSASVSSGGAYVAGQITRSRVDAAQAKMSAVDLTMLGKADKTTNDTNSAITLSAVLQRGGIKQEDASAAAQHLVADNGKETAIAAVRGIVASAGNDVVEAKGVLPFAALTSGFANRTLQGITEKARVGDAITSVDVSNLIAAAKEDKAGPNREVLDKQYANAILENRKAARTRDKLATPENTKAMEAAQSGLTEARKVRDRVAQEADQAQQAFEIAKQNANDAVSDVESNPVNKDYVGPVQQQMAHAEAADAFAQQKQEELAIQEEKVKEMATKKKNVEQEQLTKARAEATTEVLAEVQQEQEAEVQQEQQEFETALNTYKPTQAFNHPVTVNRADGNGSVQVTGIFAHMEDGTTIFTTTDGYISDSELDAFDEYDELDKAMDQWYKGSGGKYKGINTLEPAAWLGHSVKATDEETGETIDIVGIAGKTSTPGVDEPDPIVIDANGKKYNAMDLSYTDNDGFMYVMDTFDNATDLPTITDEETFSETNPDVQLPEGTVIYPGGPFTVYSYQNGSEIEIVGYFKDSDDQVYLVSSDGSTIPSGDVYNQPSAFDSWLYDQLWAGVESTGESEAGMQEAKTPEDTPEAQTSEGTTETQTPEETTEEASGVQYPEGTIFNPDGPATMTDTNTQEDVEIVGAYKDQNTGNIMYVGTDGTVYDAGNITNEPAGFFDWAIDAVTMAGLGLDHPVSNTGTGQDTTTTSEQTTSETTGSSNNFSAPEIIEYTGHDKPKALIHGGDQVKLTGVAFINGKQYYVDEDGQMYDHDEIAFEEMGLYRVFSDFWNWATDQLVQKSNSLLQSIATQGKVNPETNAPLKDWQDPKYHGAVKNTKAKWNPKSTAFKAWQNLDQIPEAARKYFVNADGSPKVYYRGVGSFSEYLRTVHNSSPFTNAAGKKMYVNFYMDLQSTAKTYAGTSKILKLRGIKNWETAQAAMQDLGLDLVEAQDPNGSGKMGYQVMRKTSSGHMVPVQGVSTEGHTSQIPWFAENELKKFKNTYGGNPKGKGIYAGYVTATNPLVIQGNGANYTSVYANVTAPDGAHIEATQKTRKWAEWAFNHGYDAVVFDQVKDNAAGGGDVGIEIVTSQPEQFKSVYNEGKWSKDNPNIMALKVGKKSSDMPKPKTLKELMGTEDLSEQFKGIMSRFFAGEDVPQEELEATPEFQWANSVKTPGDSVSRDTLKKIQAAGQGQITYEAVEAMLPEDMVKRIYDIKSKLDLQGSTVFDSKGEPHYTGDVEQGKRLDLMIGLAASGKSTIADYLSNMFKSRFLDSDQAKALHPEDMGGINEDYVHNESKIINDLRLMDAAKRGDNVLFSVIGDSLESVLKRIQPFLSEGYSVHLHMTDLDKNKAIGRVLGRMASTGRFLNFDYLRKIDPQNILKTFEALKGDELIDGYARWNTDIPKGSRPIPVDYSGEGEIDIFRGGLLGRTDLDNNLEAGGPGNGNGTQIGSDNGGSGQELIQALKAKHSPPTSTQKQAEQTKTKLKSPQQIAKTLINSLGFGNYMGSNNFGDLPKSIRAYWDRHGELISVKDRDIGDYTATIHEVGHGIAQRLGLRGTKQMAENLIAEEPEFGKAYSENQLRDEAFAEFMWRYMTNDQMARDFAGDAFVDDFEKKLARDPATRKAVNEAKNNLRQYINSDLDARTEAVIKWENTPEKVPFREQFKKLISRNVDSTAVADEIDAFIEETTGQRGKLRLQGLFANHSQKRAITNLTDSLTDANGTRIGDGLGKLLADIGFKGTEENIHLLEKYALWKHSIDRDREGKPVFSDDMTTQEREAKIKEIEDPNSAGYRPDIVAAEKVWQNFRHEFLQAWMVDTGYWSQELLDQLEKTYPHYVPTFRVRGDTMTGEGSIFGKNSKKYTMKEAVGGSEDIYSPMYSFIGMVDQITGMVAQNQVARLFDQYYQDNEGMGIFARQIPGEEETQFGPDESKMNARQKELMDLLENEISDDLMEKVLEIAKGKAGVNEAKTGGNEIAVQREDGTVVRYEVRDPELYKLLSGVQGSTGIRAAQIIGKLTRTMSMLTTGSNPLFAARNAIRDYQNSVNYGSWASNYLSGIPKWIKALADVVRNADVYQEYKAMGGGGWTRIDRNNTKNMKEISSEIFGDDKSNVGKTAKWLGKKVWSLVTFEGLNEAIEQASRLAEYKSKKHDRSTSEGRLEAFQAAQDATVDFSRSGNSETAYVLKKLVPFFGAALQGAYRTGRTFTEAERGRLGQRLTKTIVNQALASALAAGLILRTGDDDDKEEFMLLSDGVKANHLILPNPLKGQEGQPPFLRIPLAQDPISYAIHNLVTNAMVKGSDDEMAIELAATADVILDNLNPLGSGTIFQPFIDASKNKTWYGSNLVRTVQQEWADKSAQYNEDTPEIFKTIGRLLGESPEVVEYLATQYTGFLGAMAIPALTVEEDGSLGGLDALMNSIKKKWTSDPMSSNDLTKTFYEMKNILSTITGEASADRPQNMLLRSLTQEQVDQAYEEAKAMTGSGGIVYETSKAITDAYKKIDKVNGNTTLTDDEKYTQTRQIKLDLLHQVEAANDEMQVFYKKYIQGETLTDRVFGEIRKRFEEGKYAHIKTDVEKMPDTFQEDLERINESEDEPDDYMVNVMDVYNGPDGKDLGGGKAAALPHPDQSFTLTLRDGKKEDYTIDDEEWDWYTDIYKREYERYVKTSDKGKRWKTLNYEEKYDVLKAAHASANKKMKETWARDHKIMLKK